MACIAGKLRHWCCVKTAEPVEYSSKHLHVTDRGSGLVFLIDTGPELSLIPASQLKNSGPDELILFAANDTRIRTFGQKQLSLGLGFKNSIAWNFCIAELPHPILGADFLSYFGIQVDIRKRPIFEPVSGQSIIGTIKSASTCSVSFLNPSDRFHAIVSEYLDITRLLQYLVSVPNDVEHHMLTHGPPLAKRVRRLSPEKLEIVKEQIKYMTDTGICHLSKSPWAAPLPIVPKKMENTASAVITEN